MMFQLIINTLNSILTGDGVFTTRSFESGDFLLVYRGDLIKSHKYARQLEDEYEQKGEGSFMFYFKNKGRSYW